MRTLFAANPYIASGSSPERAMSVANVVSMPKAPVPFRMYALSELKVRKEPL